LDRARDRPRTNRRGVESHRLLQQIFKLGEEHQFSTASWNNTSRIDAGNSFFTSIHCKSPCATVATGSRYTMRSLLTPVEKNSLVPRLTVSSAFSAIRPSNLLPPRSVA